jgi:hypothetical protein
VFNGMNWIAAGVLGCGAVCMMAGMTALAFVMFQNRRYHRLREQNQEWSKWQQTQSRTSSKHDTSAPQN